MPIDPAQALQYYAPFPWPDYYPPRERKDNLIWRAKARIRCESDPNAAQAMKELCRRDVLFWWSGFCWIQEVRENDKIGKTLPFIPWDYQCWIARVIREQIDAGQNLAIPKSRDMGLTWIFLLLIEHAWFFESGFGAMVASKVADLVDSRGDMNTLFGKLRFNLYKQPAFLMPKGFNPKLHDKSMLLKNPETEGQIAGASTTGDVGRAGRMKVLALDEHAAIHPNDQSAIEAAIADAAPCCLYISTPRGDQNTFFKKCHGNTRRIDVHWSLHPKKGAGCFQEVSFRDGKTVRGKVRSPWYDAEIKKRDQPGWQIAQELDISFSGSTESICDPFVLQTWRQSAPEPITRLFKEHRFDGEAALLVWEWPLPGCRYGIGGDPSGGTLTGSHSAAQVFKLPGLDQVAEYQGRIGLDIFSSLLYYLGQLYNWAYISVEENMGMAVLNDLVKGHIDRNGIMGERDARITPYPRNLIAKHTKPDGKPDPAHWGIITTESTKRFMAYSLLEPMVRNQDLLIKGKRTLSELAAFHDTGSKICNPDGDDLAMALCIFLYGNRFMRKVGAVPNLSGISEGLTQVSEW